jgi:hypothetical protein
MFAVISQFGHRFTDVIQRLMGALLLKAAENFRLPTARQLLQRADVQIALMEVGL